MLAQCGIGVHEHHALLLKVFANLVIDDFRFVLSCHAGNQALLLGFGDPQLVVGVFDVCWEIVPTRCLLLGGTHEVFDVVEINATEI